MIVSRKTALWGGFALVITGGGYFIAQQMNPDFVRATRAMQTSCFWCLLLVSIFTPILAEELVFRKFLLSHGWLRRHYWFSATSFVAWHYVQSMPIMAHTPFYLGDSFMTWAALVNLCFFTAALTLLRLKTTSMAWPIALHWLVAWGFLVMAHPTPPGWIQALPL